jgi:biotin carboxylase
MAERDSWLQMHAVGFANSSNVGIGKSLRAKHSAELSVGHAGGNGFQTGPEFSLSFSDLQSIPRECLQAYSKEGQELRTALLRDACIVFFCAGYPGKKFIYEIAKKRGVRSIIVDNHDSWAKELATSGIISDFIGVDMAAPADEVFKQSLDGIRALGIKPDGVCTFVELSVSISAQLAQALGCPGPDPECVLAARDKSKARRVFKDHGLPHVRNVLILSEQDISKASEYIGFPAVLKPISGAASLGVQKVNSSDELISVYRNVVSTISNLIVSAGALERRTQTIGGTCSGSQGVEARSVIDVTVMMEEYLDGQEVDVDLVMSDGKARYCKVIDNGPTYEPFFAETHASLPSLMDPIKVEELEALAIKSVEALGFLGGVFHVELKYTSKGPRLIEVNCRMGGGPTRMIHKLVSGIDLVLEQFFLAVGIPSRPIVPKEPLTRVAYAFINSRATGAVDDVSFMSEYAKRENVVWVNPYVKPYEQVIGPQDGHPSWLGDVVVTHEDGHRALEIVKEIEKEIAEDFANRLIVMEDQNTLIQFMSHTIC